MNAAIRFLQVWGVPIGMGGAYSVLAWSSETDNSGKAWMAIGFSFVLVIWFVFRYLIKHAALSRALATGDSARVLGLTEKELRTKTKPAARAPLLALRARAFELRGDWTAALSTLDEIDPAALPVAQRPAWRLMAATIRVEAHVERGEAAQARQILDRDVEQAATEVGRDRRIPAHVAATLARGEVLWGEGAGEAALVELAKVIDDVRATETQRATAHFYAARIERDPKIVARHRREAARLAPGTWVAGTS